ncbi:MAG TPA: hypothetical protein VFR61_09795, partial [Nitrososphaeraceae archaeon]|nr:hypothetical protein [Nitrososphaeraceae archaeon]
FIELCYLNLINLINKLKVKMNKSMRNVIREFPSKQNRVSKDPTLSYVRDFHYFVREHVQ